MNKEDDKERGILIRILSNKDIQKGIVFFVAALILAFVAVTPATSTNVEEDTIKEDEDAPNVQINYPIYDVINATLELEIVSEEEGRAYIEIQNETNEVLEEKTLTRSGAQEIIDLEVVAEDSGEIPAWLSFNVSEGQLRYAIIFTYTGSPYGILSLPAALFTLIGMVYAFKGKGVILGEIKRKQMEEEARMQQEERKKEFGSEQSTGEEGIEGDVIYGENGADEPTEKKGEADHINFMGIPDEEDNDERER